MNCETCKKKNVIISRKQLAEVRKTVRDKPLADFIDSLLKEHFSQEE